MSETKAKMPGGIPYIVGNEAAERFSYYGMKAILVVFLTKYLTDTNGQPDYLTPDQAKEWYHTFVATAYAFPLLGGMLSDIFFGKYKTILWLSIVYVIGHFTLALAELPGLDTRMFFAFGLGLIGLGAGGIKPCVSAHVGDQFTKDNESLLKKAFEIFYFSINFGSVISTLFIPVLLAKYGPDVAFGVPGILMALATLIFWMGRKKFIHIPAAGWQTYKKEVFSPAGIKAIGSLTVLYIFIAIFWTLYDQTGSAWVLQADQMDRMVNFGFGSIELLPSQIQAANPLLIMIFIPIFSVGIYPLMGKFFEVTPLRKMGIGMFVTAIAFAVTAITQVWIDNGATPTIMWQFFAFILITAAEVMVSITALEFSYTQAPNAMKSIIMGIFFMSVSFGNIITAVVNNVIQNPDGTSKLAGADYYWFFTALMAITAVVFVFIAMKYKEENYMQEGKTEEELEAEQNS